MELENLNDLQYGIEISILNNYLSCYMLDNSDYSEIMETKLDEKLFTKTITNTAVARAIRIHQDADYPIDDLIIKDFLDSKMVVNDFEYQDIVGRAVLPVSHFKYYLKLLGDKVTNDIRKGNLARV
tara:strand:+ start:1143 stop:1520 length:378 start_codon:yes stop_codon:yes gene_type:complete